MNPIEILNKTIKPVNEQKTKIYHHIYSHRKMLEERNISIKINEIWDFFDYEVIINALENKRKIDEKYQQFSNANYDMFEYLNYKEKQQMINHEMQSIYSELYYFKDKQTNSDIFIPVYESYVNNWFIADYQLLLLKKHADYVQYTKIDKNTPRKLYGLQPFDTQFSSLVLLRKDKKYSYYYHEELRELFVYTNQGNFLLEVLLGTKKEIDITLLEPYLHLIFDDPMMFIKILHHTQCIDDRTFNKVMKKIK